jgi:ABC-type transporter Mla subunit MlaD
MNYEREDIGLGLFVLIALLMTAGGVIVAVGALRGETIDLHVAVDGVTGLRKGSAVYIEGYRIGEVTAIRPSFTAGEAGLRFYLRLKVAADFPLYQGTRAAITNPGLIGDAVVSLLVPARPGAPLGHDDWILQTTAPGLMGVVARADSLAMAIERVAARVDDLLRPEVAGTLLHELQHTLMVTRTTMTQLEQRMITLSDTLAYGIGIGASTLEQMTALVEENRERISGSIDSASVLMGELRGMVADVQRLGHDQAPRIDRNLSELEATLGQARLFLEDLNRYSLWQMLFTVRHPDSSAAGGRRRR